MASLTSEDIREAGRLAGAAYDVAGSASDALLQLGLTEWTYVDPVTTFGIDAALVDGDGYFDFLGEQALLAFDNQTKTLALAFRGSSEPVDFLNDVLLGTLNFGSVYAPLSNFVDTVLSDSALFGANRVLVTGHSLGGALAEEVLAKHPATDALGTNLVGVSFGSPGVNDIQNDPGSDPRLINVGHVDSDFRGDPVFRATLDEKVQGSDIHVNLPDEVDVNLVQLAGDALVGNLVQHSESLYLYTASKVADEIDLTLSDGHPFDLRVYDFVIGTSLSASALTGTSGNDVIIGDGRANSYDSASAPRNDQIFGLGGNDILNGGAGDDRIDGGAGDDFIDGGDGTGDIAVYEQLTADHFNLSRKGGVVTVAGKFQPDLALYGFDTLINIEYLEFFDPATGTKIVRVADLPDLAAGTQPGGTPTDGGLNALSGGPSGDEGAPTNSATNGETIVGNETSEYLIGTSGPDVIRGNGGDDVLTGYGGQDSFDGGTGSDTVDYSYEPASVSGTVDLGAGTATFTGFYTEQLTSIENVWMGAGDDVIVGDAGSNDLRGGPGNDVLQGGSGNDIVYGDWKYSDQGGNDTAILPYTFGSGYTVSGSANALHIVGADGDDWYYNIENFEFAGAVIKSADEVLVAAAPATWIQRITPQEPETNTTYDSVAPSVSADGRYIAYLGTPTNVRNENWGVYVTDRDTGIATRETDGRGNSVKISADGTHIAFDMWSSNVNGVFVPGGVFVKDLHTGLTTPVSVNSDRVLEQGSDPSISADGRYIAFQSVASDLVPGDTNNASDVFVRDLATGTTTRVSVGADGAQANGDSIGPSVSADGRYVSFESVASNFSRGFQTVLVHDLATGATTPAPLPSVGDFIESVAIAPAITADGHYVAFLSFPGDAIVFDDLESRTAQNVSMDNITMGSSVISQLSISVDGRYIVFASNALALVPKDVNSETDIFLYDTSKATLTLVSHALNGTQANSGSFDPVISTDGRYIVFDSLASNLAAGDNNNGSDVFVVDRSLLNQAPTAHNDALSTNANSSVSGSVLADNGQGADSDPESDPLTVFAVNGYSTNVSHPVMLASGALLVVNPDGRFVYDPNGKFDSVASGQTATDSFTYAISDGQYNVTTATVTVTINGTVHSLDITGGTGTITGTSADDQIAGGAGNEIIYGGAGYDWLRGDAGNDTLSGDAGDDTLDGGPGVDTAAFSGARAQYDVRTAMGGGLLQTTVIDRGTTGDGMDTLTNVEKLQFSTHAMELAGADLNHTSNVDGSRFDDVLFQHDGDGQVLYAKMADGLFQSWGVDTGTFGGTAGDWQAVASGDMNPGATGGAEVFFEQQSTGTIVYASLDTGATAFGVVTTALTPAWWLAAVADVNGDASGDVIVQDRGTAQHPGTGLILYGDMKGGALQAFHAVTAALTADWKAVGAGDLTGDGFADVVIQSQSTGATIYADMANGAFAKFGVVSLGLSADWQVKAVADVNGDGIADLVFQNAKGDAAHDINPGITLYADVSSGTTHWGVVTPSIAASAVGTADVDNDGMAEVLFQTASGATYYANVDGGGPGVPSWGTVSAGLPNDWHVV